MPGSDCSSFAITKSPRTSCIFASLIHLKAILATGQKKPRVAFYGAPEIVLLETGNVSCWSCFHQDDREQEAFIIVWNDLFNELCTKIWSPISLPDLKKCQELQRCCPRRWFVGKTWSSYFKGSFGYWMFGNLLTFAWVSRWIVQNYVTTASISLNPTRSDGAAGRRPFFSLAAQITEFGEQPGKKLGQEWRKW